MIELHNDCLVFSFPEVHPKAVLQIDFQRTLRIPDDGRDYPLPPGLGRFPLRHVDDFADRVPMSWREHGGVMIPMYQSEALWLFFRSEYLDERGSSYPFAVKVATGKIDAITGKSWCNGLHNRPQDYLVVPTQPWLDGYCAEKGIIRQFVAMPLGAGYTAEEQLTQRAEHGGLQIIVYPMRRQVFEERFPIVRRRRREMLEMACSMTDSALPAMGLAPGGRMKQEIYSDPYGLQDWDAANSRCFVHIANSMVWQAIAGEQPPTPPLTAKAYSDAGLPWFDYFDEAASALAGSSILGKLKSIFTLGKQKGDAPLPENQAVFPDNIKNLRPKSSAQVREGIF